MRFILGAVNWLRDDSEATALVKGLETVGSFHVTALNILEAVKTRDPIRREALRALLWRLWRQRGPLALPDVVLREDLSAFLAGRPHSAVDPLPENSPLADWLATPGASGDDLGESFRMWGSTIDQSYSRIYGHMRRLLQPVFSTGPRSLSTAGFLRRYWNNGLLGPQLVAGHAHAAFGRELSLQQATALWRTRPCWAMYALAWAYMCHRRGVLRQRYGRSHNAGVFDLWSAAYLPLCDWFVTADKAQYQAFRYLVRFLPQRPRVFYYSAFRARLIPPSFERA